MAVTSLEYFSHLTFLLVGAWLFFCVCVCPQVGMYMCVRACVRACMCVPQPGSANASVTLSPGWGWGRGKKHAF